MLDLFSNIILKLLNFKNRTLLRKSSKSEVHKNLRLGNFCTVTLYPNFSKLKIECGVNIRSYCNILVGDGAELVLENNFFMNNYCSINCLQRIEIGENTLFGEGVKLYDHNHQYTKDTVEHQKFIKAPIIIGKNCWLGSNVTVLKGVTIGDNCIIGTGVLIYKDVPSNSIVTLKQELNIKEI